MALTRRGAWVYYPRMGGFSATKRWVSALLLVPCMPLAAGAQHHGQKRAERTEINLLEERWRKAQLSEDVPEMDHLLADDFLGITAAGEVVTKSQQLDRMRTKRVDITELDLADTKIKISGSLAVVTSLARLDGLSSGAPLRGYFRYTHVYQHMAGDGWKITNFEATRVRHGAEADAPNAPQAAAATPTSAVPSSHSASPGALASQPPQS